MAERTPPSGLAISNITPGTRSFAADVSITDWGSGSSHAKWLSVWTYSISGPIVPYREAYSYQTSLSSRINVSNTSTGSLTIAPNTRYILTYAAANGSETAGPLTVTDTTVTLALKATNQSVSDITDTSATINWTAPADGGYYEKTYSYSLDNGATWVQCGTVSSDSATNKTYTISNLLPGTQYTVKLRVTTSAGTTECDDFPTFTTLGVLAHPFYGSVNGQTKKIKKLYGSVNGQTKLVKHLYGSVNGVTKKIF